jgi:hypothetical protein
MRRLHALRTNGQAHALVAGADIPQAVSGQAQPACEELILRSEALEQEIEYVKRHCKILLDE